MGKARNSKDRPFNLLIYLAVTVSVFLLLTIPLLLKKNKDEITYRRPLMGTVVEITLMEGERASFDSAAEAAFNEIKRLEALFSSYRPDSDISRITGSAGGTPVRVSPEVIEVMEKALRVSEMSSGSFDPTVGVLGRAWGFSGEKGVVPEKRAVERLLPLVGYKGIYVDRASMRAGLGKKGMALNLGGVAKGFIVEKAVETLKGKGVTRGIVKAGGDLAVFQKEGSGRPFVIGIQDPRNIGKLIGEAHIVNGAVATSGDYERFFIKDSVRYHHILDPATGFPAQRSRSVTIVSKDGTIADALSTAIFVMGREGMGLIERLPDVEGVIIDREGRIHTSSGFQGRISGQE